MVDEPSTPRAFERQGQSEQLTRLAQLMLKNYQSRKWAVDKAVEVAVAFGQHPALWSGAEPDESHKAHRLEPGQVRVSQVSIVKDLAPWIVKFVETETDAVLELARKAIGEPPPA